MIGFLDDLVELIQVWLKNRSYYTSINGENLLLFDALHGTVQGSVLGPVLHATFVSPKFDLEDLSAFADDNYAVRWHRDLDAAIQERSYNSGCVINRIYTSSRIRSTGREVATTFENCCCFTP